jgi:hypothetical protein
MSDRAISDLEIIDAMEMYGGSFIKALAIAWACADPINRATIKAAFPAYWRQYRDLAERKPVTR